MTDDYGCDGGNGAILASDVVYNMPAPRRHRHDVREHCIEQADTIFARSEGVWGTTGQVSAAAVMHPPSRHAVVTDEGRCIAKEGFSLGNIHLPSFI